MRYNEEKREKFRRKERWREREKKYPLWTTQKKTSTTIT